MTGRAPPLGGLALAQAIVIGSCGLLILGVHPVFLGALVQEQRLGDAQIGNLVTIEMLAIVAGSIGGIALLKRLDARAVACLASLALAAVDAALLGRGGMGLLGAGRALAGLCEGVMVAVALVAISRVARVERASAIFLAVQTLLQAVVAAVLPQLAGMGSHTDLALMALAGFALVAAGAALFLPAAIRPAETHEQRSGLSGRALVALSGAGLFLGAIVSVWGYFGLWLIHHGHAPAFEGTAVSTCLVAQVVGALAAARIGERLPSRVTIAACALAGAGLVGLFHLARADQAAILAVSAAFGFVWLFTLPFFAGWLVEIDPARQAVLYLTAFQLGGAALLPSVAGELVGLGSIDVILPFSGAVFVVLAAVAALARTPRPAG